MSAKLYWFQMSHPAAAVAKMLELKGIDFQTVNVLPGNQRIHLRLAGFRGGTVPALKLDGRRVQGSRQIARALDQVQPEPPLFPSDPERCRQVEEAERWGEVELQNASRLLLRWALVHDLELRRWLARESRMPLGDMVARGSGPTARYYARVIGADEGAARRAAERLPEMLDRADALLADGVLVTDPPNAAALQVLSSVRALDAFSDLQPLIADRPSVTAARELFPDFPGPVPRFIPAGWLSGLSDGG